VQVAKHARNFGSMNALILTPTSMIAGCFWPVTFMPEFLIKLGYLTPQRWALVAITNAQSHESYLGSLGVLGGFGLLMIFIAIYFAKNKSHA
jgi:ABC-2 type transport system permease protein